MTNNEKTLRRLLKILKRHGVRAFRSDDLQVEFFEPYAMGLDEPESYDKSNVTPFGESFKDVDVNDPKDVEVLLGNR